MAPSFDLRRLLGGAFLAAVVASLATLVVPGFAALYASLDGQLPLLTRWTIDGHLLLWLLPFVSLAAGLAARDPARGGRRAMTVGLVTILGVAPVATLALYLPVLRIAATA